MNWDLTNAVLMELVQICKEPECTNILIRKFLNVSDLKKLESRLAGCYEELRKTNTEEEKVIHTRNRLLIENDIELENSRSVSIDEDLGPLLESLPKDLVKKYETLLKDFKEDKY